MAEQATQPAGAPLAIPEPIVLVTAAVDVQARYLAALIAGTALDGQVWVLDWGAIDGDPADPATFDALLSGLSGVAGVHPILGELPVHLVGIDSGFRADDVYRAVRSAPKMNWAYGTKGEAGRLGDPIILPRVDVRDALGRRRGYRPIRINTDAAKEKLLDALSRKPGELGSWHFPKRLDAEFYQQLTCEEKKPAFNAEGVQVGHSWVKTRERNEALDCAVITLALWHFLADRQLFDLLVRYLGRDEARERWMAAYPSGRRF